MKRVGSLEAVRHPDRERSQLGQRSLLARESAADKKLAHGDGEFRRPAPVHLAAECRTETSGRIAGLSAVAEVPADGKLIGAEEGGCQGECRSEIRLRSQG